MKITKMKHLQNTYPLIGGQRLAKECSSKKLGFWEERDFLLKAPAKSPFLWKDEGMIESGIWWIAREEAKQRVSHIIFSSLCEVGGLGRKKTTKLPYFQSVSPSFYLKIGKIISNFSCLNTIILLRNRVVWTTNILDLFICHTWCFLESNHVKSADTENLVKLKRTWQMLVPFASFVHFPRGLACFAIFLKGLPGHRYSVGTLSSAFLAFVSRFCTLSKSIFGFVHSPKKEKGIYGKAYKRSSLEKPFLQGKSRRRRLFSMMSCPTFFIPPIILINFWFSIKLFRYWNFSFTFFISLLPLFSKAWATIKVNGTPLNWHKR